jgi:hypothetical protein
MQKKFLKKSDRKMKFFTLNTFSIFLNEFELGIEFSVFKILISNFARKMCVL